MRKKVKTIKLAKIRRLIRTAIDWSKIDDGTPTHWSSKNYKKAIRMRGKILLKKEKNFIYYTRSSRALENIAKKIYKIARER